MSEHSGNGQHAENLQIEHPGFTAESEQTSAPAFEVKDWVPKPIDIEPDQVLNFTQGIRKEVVMSLVSSGVPQDNKDRSALLETLRDMDKTSLGVMKLNTKERELDIGARTQMALQRLTETLGVQNPMAVSQDTPIDGTATRVPQLSLDAVPQVELAEGETLVGIENIRYEEFMATAVEKGIAKPTAETKASAVPVQSN